MSSDFMQKAVNAWRTAACQLPQPAYRDAAHPLLAQYPDLPSLQEVLQQESPGR